MKKSIPKSKKISKFVYWTPRILSIIFTLFLALFSLDVFEESLSFWQVLTAFLMHNIPVFILAIIIWISWKRELVGAIAFALAGLLYILVVLRTALTNGFEWYYLAWIVQISGIAFLVGILFFMNWRRKKK